MRFDAIESPEGCGSGTRITTYDFENSVAAIVHIPPPQIFDSIT
jgi:hypothetical protein